MDTQISKASKTTFQGNIMYIDLEEMQNSEQEDLIEVLPESESITVFELPVPKPPKTKKDPYRRLKADQANTDFAYGGTYNLWLYKNKTVLGTWKYLKDAKQNGGWKNPYQTNHEDLTLDGTFHQYAGNLFIKALVLERGVPKYGLVMQIQRLAE